MQSARYKNIVENLLNSAGIQINGSNPWDIQVFNDKFYKRVLLQGELGLGESYMDGWWTSEQPDEMIHKILSAHLEKKIKINIPLFLIYIRSILFNMQSKTRSFIVGEKHYDTGNDLFINMLDKRMNYSCGYWKNASNLDEAQENKLELICRKLRLEPGMKVLDIGSGWGAFAKYAAENYGVQVVGYTVSKEQLSLANKMCEGLPVEFRLSDYREINEKFDRIVSIGMFEHVGYKNYRTFFKVCHNALKDDGLFLLHTIGSNVSTRSTDAWTHKYIFPNGMLPSISQIGKNIEKLFVMEDWHNFGADYDKTLMAWHANFKSNWDKIKSNYDDRFYRMWEYFLLSCAGAFRARKNQLWQIVLSKNGIPGGYFSFR